jgi:hypothetical protein
VSQPVYLYPENERTPTYLTQVGTQRDLEAFGITLEEGLRLTFYDYDASDTCEKGRLIFEGTVHYDQQKGQWFAVPDPSSFHFEPDSPEGK